MRESGHLLLSRRTYLSTLTGALAASWSAKAHAAKPAFEKWVAAFRAKAEAPFLQAEIAGDIEVRQHGLVPRLRLRRDGLDDMRHQVEVVTCPLTVAETPSVAMARICRPD